MDKIPTFLLAPDSFKGSMTADEVCEAMEKGIRQVFPSAVCYKIPMADGGEGTAQSLTKATGGTFYPVEVTGPLGKPAKAFYGLLGDKRTAVIEMASAAGLQLVEPHTLNPLYTTTYGVGQLLERCLDKGISRVILGIGGSATNDGGAGFAQAIGIRLLDAEGCELPFGGEALSRLTRIDLSGIDRRIDKITLEVACDVTNPLCGPSGASVVFGPQKGATPEMVRQLDQALSHYAQVIESQIGIAVAKRPGTGAAGGLGFALLAFTPARLSPGVELMIRYTGLQQYVDKADYIFTGEGRIDSQTLYGKTPFGVAQAAKEKGKPLIAIAGQVGEGIEPLYSHGFTAIHSILPHPMPLEEALRNGPRYVEQAMAAIVRYLP